MSKRLAATAAIWSLAFWVAAEAQAAKVYTGWVIPEVLTVRSGRSTTSRAIGTLKRGQKVYVSAFADGWCWAKLPNGQWGFVAEKYVQFSAHEGREIAKSTGQAPASSSSDNGGSHRAAWVKPSGANVRSGPGLKFPSYGTRPGGTKVYVVGRSGDWAKVRTPGGMGFILADLLTSDAPGGSSSAPAGEGRRGPTLKAYVSGDQVYLRSGPGTRFDSRASLGKGQTVYIFQKSGDWLRARVHDGGAGWLYAGYVRFSDDLGQSHGSGRASPPPNIPDFPSPTRQYVGGEKLTELPAWVDDTTACVRFGPGVESDVKTVLDRGTKVAVTDISGHWCKVRTPSGSYGWMAGWVLDFDGPGNDITADVGGKPVEVKVGWIARPELNLRSGPGTDAPVIGKAKLSTQVVILGQQDNFYKVGLDGGREAWVASWLVDTREQRMARTPDEAPSGSGAAAAAVSAGADSSDFGQRIVETALRYTGSPYVHGCSGEGGAFDCSGFTSYVYRQYGIGISRSVVEQYRQGTPVSRSDLSMGDCIFFAGTCRSGISHVGIYVGNGNFVHAANSRSGVKITSLDEPYYASKYAGARRMR